MKNLLSLLSLTGLLTIGATDVAVSSSSSSLKPAVVAQCPSYEDGRNHALDYKADLAAIYGVGTPDYQSALDAEIATARYNARNAECPTYWRGYAYGLAN